MDLNALRFRRGEAMRSFDDGKIPEAEAELSALISQVEAASDPWTTAEVVALLQDRATVRRFSNRWQEALDDLSHGERVASRLALLPRRLLLPSVYFVRAQLLSTPNSTVFDPTAAAAAVRELRKYSSGWTLDSLEAEIALNLKEWDKALLLYRSAADALERESWMQGLAACRSRMAECFLEMNQLAEAEAPLSASLQFLEKSGPPDMLSSARLIKARLRAAQGDADTAWDLALESLSGLESLVRYFRDIGEQQRFLANKLRFYDKAFAIAQSKAGPEGTWRAWSVAERAKSFYLCQLVANAEIPLFDGIDPKDIARLHSLESQLDDSERAFSRLSTQDKSGVSGQSLQQQVNALSQQKRELLASMMKQNPRWGVLKTPPPFDLKAELKKLGPSWIAVSYFWISSDTDKTATLHVFWAAADRTPQTIAIPWSTEDLAALDELRSVLRGNVAAWQTPFPSELASKVLPPALLESLAKNSTLLISPHDRLKGIPLHAIPLAEDEVLIQKVPVQFIPTLTLLTLRSAAKPADQILLMGCPLDGFGDPPLNEVESEISSLARTWQSRVPGKVRACIIPPDGSPKQSGLGLEQWCGYGILHFACHGEFPEGSPFDASLRLGNDAVRASEFFSVRLGNASVFLSACALGSQEYGSGKPSASDEWIGLYLPLFYSGAQQLLVSLYNADSSSAMKFMMNVHTSLSQGSILVSACQQAIKAAIDQGIPPARWANWYLVGLPT